MIRYLVEIDSTKVTKYGKIIITPILEDETQCGDIDVDGFGFTDSKDVFRIMRCDNAPETDHAFKVMHAQFYPPKAKPKLKPERNHLHFLARKNKK